MDSLLGKIYSWLLHEGVQLWVVIAEIGMDMQMAYKHLSLKPWIAKYFSLKLQSKIAVKVTQVAECGRLYCKR